MPKGIYIRTKPGPTPYNKGHSKARQWLLDRVSHAGDECLIWPFSREGNGRGNFSYLGVTLRAHRYMCELVNGPPPTPDHHAAHSCGNGHLACVHPKHLSWKTQSENELDKRVHGTAGGGANGKGGCRTNLTAEQIADIRTNKDKQPAHVLAAKYGIKRGGVRYWQSTTHDPYPPGSSRSSIQRRNVRVRPARG